MVKCTGGGASLKGPHRKENEDAWRVYQDQGMVRRAERGLLYAVADGVGGTRSGRYASWHVVDSLALFFNIPAERFDPQNTVRDIIINCHGTLTRLAREKKEYTMAATTLSLLYVAPASDVESGGVGGYVLGIGDSPVLLLRGGTLTQLNQDHRDERAKVTSAVGSRLIVSRRTVTLREGDVFCLCTDGVREELSDEELVRQLERFEHPASVAQTIVSAAELAGGRDNATAVVVRVGSCPSPTPDVAVD